MFSAFSQLHLGRLVACTVLLSALSCSNALEDFSDKSSDTYLIAETKKHMDRLDFDDAIATITPVLRTRGTDPEVRYLASAAYAGRAGLRVLNLLLAIPQGIDSKGLLQIFAEHFTEATATEAADMEMAVAIAEGLSDVAAERPGEFNFYMLFLYYARIGVILNRYALDEDKVLRSNFTACESTSDFAAVKTGIPDADIDTIMITLPRVIETAELVAGGASGVDSVIGTDVETLVGVSLPTEPIPCASAVDASDIAACQAVRSMLNRGPSVAGIGLDSPGDVTGGVCVP